MRSPNFRVLIESLPIIPAKLVVPEVVIDEVVNRFREDLSEAQLNLEKSLSAADRLLREALERREVIKVETEVSRYRTDFLALLSSLGAEVLPYPEIPHKEVVARDLQRKKPFARDGRGYRDYLIWISVKRQMSYGTERLVLVSGNTRDFGEAPELDADLKGDLLNPRNLEYFRSLREFNERHVLPRLRMLEDLKAELRSHGVDGFDIPAWVRRNLLDMLRDAEIGWVATGFPDGVGSVRPNEISSFDTVRISDLRKLESGKLLVKLEFSAEVEFSIDVDWQDYREHAEVREWFGPSEAFQFSWTQSTERLEITVDLIVNPETGDVESEDLGKIAGPFGDIDLSSW